MPDIALILSIVAALSLLCQWVAWRVKLPAILFLLITGLLVGPTFQWLNPDQLFGDLLLPFVSLSVAIILFEGSLTLHLSEFKELGTVVQRMVSIGALTTWLVVAVATHFILGFSVEISALFGAVMVVTGPTVIVPMLRTVQPTRKIANTLRWEGIVIDPIGALLAVVTYEFIISNVNGNGLTHGLRIFAETIGIGLLMGITSGFCLATVLRRHWMPEYLHGLAALSLVLMTFTFSNNIHHESGLLAVTVMGMWIGNAKGVDIHHILNFKENLTVLLISILFIILAARIDFQSILLLGWQPVLILLVIQFVARPIKILISTYNSDFNWREKALLAWIAPRGIVAAAIAAIFSERLVALGYADAAYLIPLTFWIIIGTVVLQSATSRPIAKLLGVAEPDRNGYLILGANNVARKIATALDEQGIRCLLADSNWENIRQARMLGLEVYYGNPISDHADLYLDLAGIGGLLTLAPTKEFNTVAAIHFKAEFGAPNIYGLQAKKESDKNLKHYISQEYHGQNLFMEGITYAKLASLLSRENSLKTTTLSESFSWEAYLEKNKGDAIPLFYVTHKNVLKPFVVDTPVKPQSDWKIISLLQEEKIP
jgi:NhaP-type Na+/H+ or K+/H+ antiporter